MAYSRGLRWDVIGWLAIGAVSMALPTTGILLAHSTLWNVIWWVVFVVWSGVFMANSSGSALGIFLSLLLLVIYFEVLPEGRLWAYGLAGVQILLLSGAYNIHCKALGHRPAQEDT